MTFNECACTESETCSGSLTCLDGDLFAGPLVSAALYHRKTWSPHNAFAAMVGCWHRDVLPRSACMKTTRGSADSTSDTEDLADFIVVQEFLHARYTVQTDLSDGHMYREVTSSVMVPMLPLLSHLARKRWCIQVDQRRSRGFVRERCCTARHHRGLNGSSEGPFSLDAASWHLASKFLLRPCPWLSPADAVTPPGFQAARARLGRWL